MDWYSLHVRRRAVSSWIKKLEIRKPKISISTVVILLVIQLAGAFSVLYGISWYSIPIALIVGGIGAILAVEFQSSREPKLSEGQVRATQNQIKLAIAANEDPFDPKYGVPLNAFWVTYAASLRKQR